MEEQTERWPSDLTAVEIAATRSVLAKASELIPTPAKWTRRELARNNRGKEVSPLSTDAARFCVLGALLAAIHRLYVAPLKEGAPDVGGPPWIEQLTAKVLAFVGFAMALISCDRQVTRCEPTRIGFLDPENGGDDGFIYCDYWKLPAIINDSPGVKHRDVLELLDRTREFLDWIEKVMDARPREGKPVGKRVRTNLTDPPSSKPSSGHRGRASKPSGGEAPDES